MDRLFLYLDILGFGKLIENCGRAEKLYEKIDRLSVFGQEPYFKCIVFSDTMLVYTDGEGARGILFNKSIDDMCLFVKELFYSFVQIDVHFRGILTRGQFQYSKLENIEAYFGEALVRTYLGEKEIQCCGLFIDNALVPHCQLFPTSPYNSTHSFVHLMQHLETVRYGEEDYPLPPEIIMDTDMEDFLAYDFTYLRNVAKHMKNVKMAPRDRNKYLATWQMLRNRYGGLLDAFERNGYEPRAVVDFDFSNAMKLVAGGNGFFG